MQTKNEIEKEIIKNENKLLVSESLKDIVSFEEDVKSNKSNFSISFDGKKQFPVYSYVKKKNKTNITIHVDDKVINCLILETFSHIDVIIDNSIIKKFEKDKYIFKYKINLIENNSYILVLKVWSFDNGI